jgi:GNAT superfamily N-acetyltransferase
MISTMTRVLQIRQATTADMQAIIGLIDEASAWLGLKGTDQWAQPWPSRRARDHRVRRGLRSGRTWIVSDQDCIVATVTGCQGANLPMLWDRTERAESAVYVSRLIVNRRAAGQGIGANLIDWVGARAWHEWGARWIRIDVWTTNQDLHKYYETQGFHFRRICDDANYPSGALFQKSTSSLMPRNMFCFVNGDAASAPGEDAAPAEPERYICDLARLSLNI